MKMEKWAGKGIVVLLSFSLCFLGSFLSGTVFAAEKDFPKKEVTIILNFGAGGGRDVLARGVARTMSKYLGVPVVVLNEPGAGGARGIIHLYNSAPDGYAIGISASTEIIRQIVEKHEYDMKKFLFIGRVQSSPLFFFVRSDSPIRSLKDFKTFGKPVRHATSSLTLPTTVAAMVIANREGFPLTIVAGYKTIPTQILSVLRGETEFLGAQLSTTLSYIQSKELRPIVVLDRNRSAIVPDTPTMGEVGHKDLEYFSLDYWFMAPPKVPKARIEILEDALLKTTKDPEFLKWAKGSGVDVSPLNSEDTTKQVLEIFGALEPYKEDIEKYMKKK